MVIKMSDGDVEREMDFKGMYEQISKEKREYKDQLSAVLLSSTTLELLANTLIMAGVKKVKSPLLEEQLKHAYTPVNAKLRLLRFADLIDENTYKNLSILFRIRNSFSHELFITAKQSTAEFDALKNALIGNAFVEGLPNDSKKFQLLASKYSMDMMRTCKKLDPSSVTTMEIENPEDIKELHEYE